MLGSIKCIKWALLQFCFRTSH